MRAVVDDDDDDDDDADVEVDAVGFILASVVSETGVDMMVEVLCCVESDVVFGDCQLLLC